MMKPAIENMAADVRCLHEHASANIEQVEGIIYCQDDMPDSHMRLVKFMLSAYAMADTFSVLFETLYNLSDKSVTQLSNMYNVM